MGFLNNLFGKVEDTVDAIQRSREVGRWIDLIGEAEKREEKWRKGASEVVELYEQGDTNPAEYNILFANTETLSPAVYNNTPRPVVKRRTQQESPIAVAAAKVVQATLVYLTDTSDRDEETFDDLQKTAVLEALVPGRGMARFCYEADMEDIPADPANPQAAATQRVTPGSEKVCGDSVPWNRMVTGYAKVWSKVPFIAFEHFMTREELVEQFGKEKGSKIKLTHTPSDSGDKADKMPADSKGVKFGHVWEIWVKSSKKVIFISEGFPDVIEENDDPLQLEGFYPCPRPVQFINRVSSLVPQTLYAMYKKQAEELETATRRISGILKAMKVRGMYDGTLQGLDDLMTKPENTLVKAENVAAMQQGQTLDKAIWFMPLEQLVGVLQQLYTARQQIIQTIYQITGIADIMRGASTASETLGAQEIKQQWGTMRLKRMQKEVQRFTRDCYRMQAELAIRHFSLETFQQMTGLQYPTKAAQAQAQMQLDQLKQMGMQMQAAGQQPPPPEMLQQKVAPLQQVLSQPAWEDIIAFLKQDTLTNFVIDIETNSTIDVEATEDREELAGMMNALAQLMNGVFPMVQEGVLPFEAAKALVLDIVKKFRVDPEVEEVFRNMQQPAPKQDPKAQAMIQGEQLKQQTIKAQGDQKMQLENQKAQLELQAMQAEIQQKRELAQMEMAQKQAELQFAQRELAMREEAANAKHQRDMATIAMKAVMPPAAPAAAPAGA